MFEELSYIGYTGLYCLPPLVMLWLRKEFFEILAPRLKGILLSTLLLTAYGSLIWPVALKYGAWAYRDDRITNIKLLGYVYLDDVVWWGAVSFLFASVVTVSSYYEHRGVDIIWREVQGLCRSFLYALKGFRIIPLERNSTIHAAAAAFILLEAVLFKVSKVEWFFVTLAIAAVLGFEIFNSAIERLASTTADDAKPDAEIGLIKDAAAAGVLVSAMAAAVIGISIFLSRIVVELL